MDSYMAALEVLHPVVARRYLRNGFRRLSFTCFSGLLKHSCIICMVAYVNSEADLRNIIVSFSHWFQALYLQLFFLMRRVSIMAQSYATAEMVPRNIT